MKEKEVAVAHTRSLVCSSMRSVRSVSGVRVVDGAVAVGSSYGYSDQVPRE